MDGTSSPTPCRRVLLPEGTAPSAHVPGIDIAGKTGSAQIVSLATRARFKNSDDLAQNGWFVGFTPRRNPDIVVCVLFQGGEHGRLAARLATQVIKAYVDKQRRTPTKMVEKPKSSTERWISAVCGPTPDSDGRQGNAAGRTVRSRLAKKAAGTGHGCAGNGYALIEYERESGSARATAGERPRAAAKS